MFHVKLVHYSLLITVITQIDHNITLRIVNYFHEHSLIKLITCRFLEYVIFLKRPAADLPPSLWEVHMCSDYVRVSIPLA